MSLQLADAQNRLLYRTTSHSISGEISLPFTDPAPHRENTVHLLSRIVPSFAYLTFSTIQLSYSQVVDTERTIRVQVSREP